MGEVQGVPLILSGPSGAGKSTLLKKLRLEFDNFFFSVSYTTRLPRPGEVNGQDYHFVPRERFLELRKKGFFAEWAKVHGNFYGTPLQPVQDALRRGEDIVFDIDVQGARQLQNSLEHGVYVFVFPPSRKILEERLQGRGSECEADFVRRIRQAREEVIAAQEFDYWLVNADLEAAYDGLRSIYLAERLRKERNLSKLNKILAGWRGEYDDGTTA